MLNMNEVKSKKNILTKIFMYWFVVITDLIISNIVVIRGIYFSLRNSEIVLKLLLVYSITYTRGVVWYSV